MKTLKTAILLMFATLIGGLTPSAAWAQDVSQCLPPEAFPPTAQVTSLRDEAIAARNKTSADFSGCPSSAAQELYDRLQANLTTLQRIRDRVQSVNPQSVSQLSLAQTCRSSAPCSSSNNPTIGPRCDALARRLAIEWSTISQTVTNAISATEQSLANLRSLRCFTECNRIAKLVGPRIILQPIQLRNPFQVPVYTGWNAGSFSVNFDSGEGKLSQSVRSKLPQLTGKETISICPEWNTASLLEKLKQQKIVPADVTASNLQISAPERDLRIVSSITQTTCSKQVKVCQRTTGGQKILADGKADPLALLSRSDCAETVEIGCSQPAFGLTANFTQVKVQDLTRVKISWDRSSSGRGSVTVDLSKPEYIPSCNPRPTPPLPILPELEFKEFFIDLPFVCSEPRLINLVARH